MENQANNEKQVVEIRVSFEENGQTLNLDGG
jgi:hypothetical protein